MKKIEYEITYNQKLNEYELYSITETNFGGPARNWITSNIEYEEVFEILRALTSGDLNK